MNISQLPPAVSQKAEHSLHPRSARAASRRGFTLLELMVSMSVLAVIMALVFQMLGSTQKAWAASKARTSVFREAREAFESMTRTISQATLNTYWDYKRSGANGIPTSYDKKSDLHFVCAPTTELIGGGGANLPGHAVFFQAPGGFTLEREHQGLSELLNPYGFFVKFDDGVDIVPSFLPDSVTRKSRFRLMEFRPPSEDMAVYKAELNNGSSSSSAVDRWFADEWEGRGQIPYTRPIAENVLLLVIEPKQSEAAARQTTNKFAPDYVYDSRARETGRGSLNATEEALWEHVVPPILDVTMVAMDEASAIRYEQINGVGSIAGLGLHGLFDNTSRYEADLEQLDAILNEAKIDYRVFRETVAMKNSAWEAQVNIP